MLTHRRSENKLSDRSIIIQFCENDDNLTYGDYIWALKTKLAYAPEIEELIEFAAAYYNTSNEDAETLINPKRIVESAGAWDDEEFIIAVWESLGLIGCETQDGAIVIDRDSVKIEKI